jgi:hypothetical protein
MSDKIVTNIIIDSRLIRQGEKEFEKGDKAYVTVIGSIEQFEGNYDAKAQI